MTRSKIKSGGIIKEHILKDTVTHETKFDIKTKEKLHFELKNFFIRIV